MPETKINWRFIGLALLAVSVFIFFVSLFPRPGRVGGVFIQAENVRQLPLAENAKTPYRPKALNETPTALDVSARAVLVKDRGSSTVLFAQNATLPVPIASLTKLMTALLAHRYVPLDDVVVISAEDVRTVVYRAELVPGERITVEELLKAMLVGSANDAALALARHIGGSVANFVNLMNREAKQLGMASTLFTNPVGFDEGYHYSTAADLSVLTEEFLRYPKLVEMAGMKEVTVHSVNSQFQHRMSSTNELLERYAEVVGLKTGYTAEAKGNLVVLVNTDDGLADRPPGYYFIILGSDNREQESEKIIKWVKENFEWN